MQLPRALGLSTIDGMKWGFPSTIHNYNGLKQNNSA